VKNDSPPLLLEVQAELGAKRSGGRLSNDAKQQKYFILFINYILHN
jgi:hypothetical protein